MGIDLCLEGIVSVFERFLHQGLFTRNRFSPKKIKEKDGEDHEPDKETSFPEIQFILKKMGQKFFHIPANIKKPSKRTEGDRQVGNQVRSGIDQAE